VDCVANADERVMPTAALSDELDVPNVVDDEQNAPDPMKHILAVVGMDVEAEVETEVDPASDDRTEARDLLWKAVERSHCSQEVEDCTSAVALQDEQPP